MINFEHLSMLKSILEKEKFSDLMHLYHQDSQRLIQECKDALHKEEWQHLSESAHALKGSSANVGIDIIAEMAKKLEQAAKKPDYVECLTLLGEITETQKDVLEQLTLFTNQ